MASDVNPVVATENLDKDHRNDVRHPDGNVSEDIDNYAEDEHANDSTSDNKPNQFLDKLEVYQPRCNGYSCVDDDDQFKLQCTQCERLFHYQCTKLPLYQLNHFLTKGYRKYMCAECTVVQTHVSEYMSSSKELKRDAKVCSSAEIGTQVDFPPNMYKELKKQCNDASKIIE